MSLGEETDSISYEETDRNRNIIPQVDGTVDSRESLDQTLDSIDPTKSPVKNTNTQRDIEKIDEDTSDDDIDEMIEFNKDQATTIYRKNTDDQRKRTKIVKSKKGRTTKVYAINIGRKRLLKQRREKVLQNAKDRKLAKVNTLVALQASVRANRASKDTQDIKMTDNAAIDTDNTDDAAIDTDNTNNAAIDTDNTDDAAIDADNTNNAAIDADNTDNATTDRENTDDAATSNDNTDNAATGNGNTDNAITAKLVQYTYLCLHIIVEKPKIQA